MANEDNPKPVGTETKVPFDDLCVEEIRQLKIVRVKSVREGEDPSFSYNFCPSTRGLPDDFLVMNGITWKSCDEATVSRTIRNWVQHLREENDLVEVSSSPVGILRFTLNFRGEHIALWFNAWTSTTVVIGSDGKVRKPLFAAETE
ncbi:MAG: hypothetical protein IJH50_04770 [Kiritimatiellae bacterium]|nr:hypothetical protein [Kiritimatiellia bacterium]